MFIHKNLYVLGFAAVIATQITATPIPSMREIYTSLPQDQLPIISSKTGHALSSEEKLKLIKLEDQSNGYHELAGNEDTDAFSAGQIVLFKLKTGSFLVGVRAEFGDSATGLVMLDRNGNGWRDVTKNILPLLTNEMVDRRTQEKIPAFKKIHRKVSDCASGTYAYALPRVGTVIEVIVNSDCYAGKRVVLWHLPFDGKAFVLKP